VGIRASGDTGREFTDIPGPASDDPSLEAELNERRLRLDEASRHLPTSLDRLIFRHLMDGTYDARMIADSAGCCTRTVRHAAARVVAWIRGFLRG
jgi:DNA-directed RNA polymerase specialized sigma24 family protein